jgi:hypothetical protein
MILDRPVAKVKGECCGGASLVLDHDAVVVALMRHHAQFEAAILGVERLDPDGHRHTAPLHLVVAPKAPTTPPTPLSGRAVGRLRSGLGIAEGKNNISLSAFAFVKLDWKVPPGENALVIDKNLWGQRLNDPGCTRWVRARGGPANQAPCPRPLGRRALLDLLNGLITIYRGHPNRRPTYDRGFPDPLSPTAIPCSILVWVLALSGLGLAGDLPRPLKPLEPEFLREPFLRNSMHHVQGLRSPLVMRASCYPRGDAPPAPCWLTGSCNPLRR